jgi:hypothetical protein
MEFTDEQKMNMKYDLERFSKLHSWYKHLSSDGEDYYAFICDGYQERYSFSPEEPNKLRDRHWFFLEKTCFEKHFIEYKIEKNIGKIYSIRFTNNFGECNYNKQVYEELVAKIEKNDVIQEDIFFPNADQTIILLKELCEQNPNFKSAKFQDLEVGNIVLSTTMTNSQKYLEKNGFEQYNTTKIGILIYANVTNPEKSLIYTFDTKTNKFVRSVFYADPGTSGTVYLKKYYN